METKVSKNFNEVEGKTSPANDFIAQLQAEIQRNENDIETTGDAIKQVLKQMTGTKYDNEVLKNLLLRKNSAQRNLKVLMKMVLETQDYIKQINNQLLNDNE